MIRLLETLMKEIEKADVALGHATSFFNAGEWLLCFEKMQDILSSNAELCNALHADYVRLHDYFEECFDEWHETKHASILAHIKKGNII